MSTASTILFRERKASWESASYGATIHLIKVFTDSMTVWANQSLWPIIASFETFENPPKTSFETEFSDCFIYSWRDWDSFWRDHHECNVSTSLVLCVVYGVVSNPVSLTEITVCFWVTIGKAFFCQFDCICTTFSSLLIGQFFRRQFLSIEYTYRFYTGIFQLVQSFVHKLKKLLKIRNKNLKGGSAGNLRPKPFYFWNQCLEESDPTWNDTGLES